MTGKSYLGGCVAVGVTSEAEVLCILLVPRLRRLESAPEASPRPSRTARKASGPALKASAETVEGRPSTRRARPALPSGIYPLASAGK